jgi:predicted dehydrogenase
VVGLGPEHSGVVQDKLILPGLRKIRMLRDAGFFGRMFAVRGEFGYWGFEGDWGQQAQRPRRDRATLHSLIAR